jgi:hypothetical protein
MKPVAFYDTECFPNYWLLKFKTQACPIPFSYELRAGERFPQYLVDVMCGMFNEFTCVSFNGNHYDVPMVCAALNGYTCEQLKQLNDRIILEKAKPWELGLPDWKPADHIDIMEVAPGMGGQKTYAGRIHCKTMRDLPYSPDEALTPEQMVEVDAYCGNDLSVLESLYDALAPQLQQREELSKRYGLDLRSKSDAQLAEAVLKRRCEQALGRRIYKPEIDWNMTFHYEPPSWLSFRLPSLQRALDTIKTAYFGLGATGRVEMPAALEGLEIQINATCYRLGIGGLHSSEKCRVVRSSDTHVLRDADVASYYPSLILNSGKWPKALGQSFLAEYAAIKEERLISKKLQKSIEKSGNKNSPEWLSAMVGNEGGKIMINGTFGKTGSPYSVLFAPEMMIQTTVTGQLALLMLIEMLEVTGIPVVSANTDGIVAFYDYHAELDFDQTVTAWQKITGLELEFGDLQAIYSRDINNYFAVKTDGSVKRKGEYSKAGLVEKKNPDVEICGDAVAEFLSKGTPIAKTITECRDVRKFVVVQKVAGGGVKLWGDGPRKDALVRDMVPVLQANGWVKDGRKWMLSDGFVTRIADYHTAYNSCFSPQRPEYLGKVIRWYYSTQAPGPIIYNTNGNTVGMSYGARPCMTLPDEFPGDVDYDWYIRKCEQILEDVGYGQATPIPRP